MILVKETGILYPELSFLLRYTTSVNAHFNQNTFPVIRLKICGAMQIGCGILSIIGVILDVIMINSNDYLLLRNVLQSILTTVVVIYSIGSVWESFEMSMILCVFAFNICQSTTKRNDFFLL
jgi:hypothetical protein